MRFLSFTEELITFNTDILPVSDWVKNTFFLLTRVTNFIFVTFTFYRCLFMRSTNDDSGTNEESFFLKASSLHSQTLPWMKWSSHLQSDRVEYQLAWHVGSQNYHPRGRHYQTTSLLVWSGSLFSDIKACSLGHCYWKSNLSSG